MPAFRPDVREIAPYRPGRPIAEVAREHGIDPADIVKLASNESPLPPFPEVLQVVADGAGEVHRYPDNDCRDLRHALADHLEVPADHVWVGGGSSELLRVIALAVGGPGTSAVYPWPSFVIYRLASVLSMSERIEVPLRPDGGHDLEAMVGALRDDTTVAYLCNPNNPTGVHIPAVDVARFVERVPERTLVVVDEAYFEYVTAEDYATALPLALERPNVVVTRTFSKVYGLASLRVGYAVTQPDNVAELRKAQAPFTVSSLAQLAAVESLLHQDQVAQRVKENAAGRQVLHEGLAELGVEHLPSQGNFVFFRLEGGTEETAAAFVRHGIIIRPLSGGWVRVTVGTEEENQSFLAALRAER